MKRFAGLLVFVMVFILAAGVCWGEATKKVSDREAYGLRGEVRQIHHKSEKLIGELEFSKSGFYTYRKIQRLDKENENIGVRYFDENGREIKYRELDSATSEILFEIQTVYNDQEKKYKKDKRSIKDGELIYTTNGVLNEKLQKKQGDQTQFYGTWTPFMEKESYEYDQYGNWISYITYNMKIEKNYTAQNQSAGMKVYRRDFENGDFLPHFEEIYLYDDRGLVASFQEKTYGANGINVKIEERCYKDHELDEKGNWTKRTAVDQDGKTWVETRTIMYWE